MGDVCNLTTTSSVFIKHLRTHTVKYQGFAHVFLTGIALLFLQLTSLLHDDSRADTDGD